MPLTHVQLSNDTAVSKTSRRTCTQRREQSMPWSVGVGRVLAWSAVCTCATNAFAVPLALRDVVAMLLDVMMLMLRR